VLNIALNVAISNFFSRFHRVKRNLKIPKHTFYITVLTNVPPRHIRKSLFGDSPNLLRPKYETWAYVKDLFNTGINQTYFFVGFPI